MELYCQMEALYTCATTRAFHLDLVPDTSASPFIKSLKRFISRRGIPFLMISDNATCFKNIWRPITYAYNDEFSEPLKPSHLIYGYGILSTKSTNDQNLSENEQFSTGNLSKHIKYSHNLLET